MIDRQHALLVTHQAKLLKVSRGSVYDLPKPLKFDTSEHFCKRVAKSSCWPA
jgi:hypothetical protein